MNEDKWHPDRRAVRSAQARLWLGLAARLVISTLVLAAVLRSIDLVVVESRLADVRWEWIALALVVLVIQFPLGSLRWALVLRPAGFSVPVAALQRYLWIGQLINQALPTFIGGDAVRAWYLAGHGLPAGSAIGSVVWDRIFGAVGLAIMLLALAPALSAQVGWSLSVWASISISGLILVAAIVLLFAHWLPLDRLMARAPQAVVALARVGQGLLHRPRAVPGIIVLAIGTNLLAILAFFLIARSLAVPISAEHALLFVPPALLAAMMPISIAGWGVREGVLLMLLTATGRSAEEAVALSIAFGVGFVLAALPGAVIWILTARPAVSLKSMVARVQPAGRFSMSEAETDLVRQAPAKTSVRCGGSGRVFILLPLLNEIDNVRLLLARIRAALLGRDYVVCVVDDGSIDGTREVLEADIVAGSRDLKLVYRIKTGRGSQRGGALHAALLAGLEDPSVSSFVEMDGDLSHRPEELPLGLGLIEVGFADIAIGSKYIKGSRVTHRPLSRRLVSRICNYAVRGLITYRIADYSNGYRFYNRRAAEVLAHTVIRYASPIYLTEALAIWLDRRLRVREFPSHYVGRNEGLSKLRFIDFAKASFTIFEVAWRYHFAGFGEKSASMPMADRGKVAASRS